MYSDLLDVLGNQSSSSANTRRGESDKHVAVSFKAGKMKMELQENGKYNVTPDTRRGQVQMVWESSELKWEWMDRREKTVVDSVKVDTGGKFERVETGKENERVYLWTSAPKKWEMYWMQDLTNDGEDELVAQVNQYLTNPAEAAPDAEGSGSSNNAQVDALSNILENLGMPESGGGAASGAESQAGGAAASAAAGGGTLTLADLQGAMAGLHTTSATSSTPTPLSEVVTPAAITSLLEDEEVKNRLVEMLPEEQRSIEHLEENLRSPQIQQTLRALTQALVPDDEGNLEGYHSVIANFQLDPNDGQAALAAGNPIQAFLDCVLASVEKEEAAKKKEETKAEDVMEE
eukprot:CAMPEP_0119029724 /NCGR_PEP_ID=MMETSP1176-20130426/40667_1 /TAXON_ID=265551 /ORGANISM="Synedropsis recta cf, Strain CCMP1620" /LENGTH=346 /DNA_ID=CAMNT_0006986077 /DNA_START=47 /DNA_END=1087 /DNA_ORIENTATION=+